MSDRDDDRDDRNGAGDADEPRGLIRALLALLQEMEERGERTRSGHSRGPHTSVDFSVSVGGLGDLGGPGQTDPFGTGEGRSGAEGNASSEASGAAESEPHVTTRETAEGIVVAADLPGVHEADVETRLEPDADALVIEVAGQDAARLPLQSDGWTVVDSRFANGVLEVELRRD